MSQLYISLTLIESGQNTEEIAVSKNINWFKRYKADLKMTRGIIKALKALDD